MKKETAIKLYRAAKRLGYTEKEDGERYARVKVEKNYSGRGMYNRTTFALIVPRFTYIAAMAAAARVKKEEREDFAAELEQLSSDSMGRDSIVVY